MVDGVATEVLTICKYASVELEPLRSRVAHENRTAKLHQRMWTAVAVEAAPDEFGHFFPLYCPYFHVDPSQDNW